MAPDDRARHHHDSLLPGAAPTLALTDPELVQIFDRFAGVEVPEHDGLHDRLRLMVRLASTIAAGARTPFPATARAALAVGVTPVELKEIVYQAVPYVGMTRVLHFVDLTNEVLTERGIELPLSPEATSGAADRVARGLEVQKRVVGDQAVDRMHATAPVDEQHIQRFLSGNCFGDHVARPGIDLATRELLTFAMLVSLGGCDPQVKGHVVGNLNVGNNRAQLLGVLTQLLPFIGYPRTLNGLRALDEAAPPATA